MNHISKAVLVLMGTAALAACGSKKVADLPPQPQGGGYEQPGAGGWQNSGPAAPAEGSQAHFVANVSSDRVYFDTDRYNIDNEDMASLQSQAQWLARYPGTNAVIEGHCDERGTRDYNLALGERRANAARNYLISLGIAANRVRTVSYGKERPDALGSDPDSWARNRRAVTVTIQ